METLQRTANRGSVSTGYDIDNSLKLEADNSETLYKNNVDGNRRTFTSSLWVKLSELSNNSLIYHGVVSNATRLFTNSNEIYIDLADNTSTFYRWRTNALFRDTAAWYHFVWRVDTTDSTAANRMRFYINGEEYTDWQESATVPQNFDTLANFAHSSTSDDVQFSYKEASLYSNLYLAEVHHVDGQTLAPTEFGEFDDDSGIWKPKEYTGTYGTNGFYLDFEDSSNLGNDANGGTDFTLSNITAADQATDTPTNNFCTLNILHRFYSEVSRITVTEGATKVAGSTSSFLWRGVPSTFAVSRGKWYFELLGDGSYMLLGTGAANDGQSEWATLTSIANPSTKAKMMYNLNGNIYGYDSSTDAWQYGFGFGFGTSFNVGVAVDLDNGYMYFRKDGAAWTDSGDPSSGSSGTGGIYLPWYTSDSTVFIVSVVNNNSTSLLNFGGFTAGTISSGVSDANGYGNFEYTPPSNYYSLCSKNLAEYG